MFDFSVFSVMKNLTKRTLSLLLAVMMLLSTLPMTAFAEGDVSADPAAATATPVQTATPAPTAETTTAPTATPVVGETTAPTATPTAEPTVTPVAEATPAPSATPTAEPTLEPTVTPAPSATPTPSPMPMLMMAPAPLAVDDDPQYPTDLDEKLYLAIYTGSGFPGEPAWYSTTNYKSITSSFGTGSFRTFASSAEGILSEDILDDMVPGTGSGSAKVWGVFSTTGMDKYIIGGGILNEENEDKIIKAVKGNRVDPDDYRIIWYVIKYQTDTQWHIDGIIVEAETYNVNYYGNGNTSGSAPTGATGLRENDVYTVLGNTGNLKNTRNGFSYTFLGWNTRADGTGTSYKAGDKITITGDVSLYAQWQAPTRDISISKTWNDDNNRDNLRPSSVEVHLLKNDAHSGNKLTLTAENGWKGTWEDVPALDQFGNEIEYFVEEVDVEGYTHVVSGSAASGFLLTNTHTPETFTYEVQKVWEDGSNRDGKRPSEIQVQLYKQVGSGEKGKYGDAVTLNAANGWSHEWHNLHAYEDGQKISYSAEETAVPSGYTVSYAMDSHTNSATITNTYTPETVSFTVKKSWDDENDQDRLRPDRVTLTIYANGISTGQTVTVTAADGWEKTVTELPKNQSGTEIQYSFVEESVPEYYTRTANGDASNGYVVTNKHTPANRELNITKTWDDREDQDGKRPYAIIVRVLANGTVVREVEINANDYWTKTLTDLPYNANGTAISYTVEEIAYRMTENGARVDGVPSGYTASYSGSMADGFTIQNSHTPETDTYYVEKVWNDNADAAGMRPASVQVTLYENGVPSSRADATVTLNERNAWKGAWENLPEYSNGVEISYSVLETGYTSVQNESKTGIPADYVANYTYDRNQHIATVTNTYQPKTVTLNVQKIWEDNDNQDALRPENVTVRLQYRLSGGDWTDTGLVQVLHAENEWDADFEGLTQMAFGAPVEYRVVEDAVAGYTAAYSAVSNAYVVTVTNTHTPELVSVTVSKTWDDDDDRDRIRPEKIAFELYADGVPTGKTATLSANKGEWDDTYTFENLPKMVRGRAIAYTVVETSIAGYTASYTETAKEDGSKAIEIKNTHESEKIKIPVVKVWKDDSDRDGLRPETVTVNLLADGKIVQTKELSVGNNWSVEFETPKNKDGKAIVYEIDEVDVEGYTSVISRNDATGGYTITNTHKIETITLSAEKVWADDDNRDRVRPDSVTLHLTLHGEHMGESYKRVLSNANGWEAEWKNLPRYEEGILANYVVVEEAVEGYAVSYARAENDDYHTIVTNTRSVDKTSITVQKIWDDANNQDNLRPASVQLQLTANGENHGDPVVLTESEHWRYTFTDLPKNADGQPIAYSAKELLDAETAKHYTTMAAVTDPQTGLVTITNKHTPATVEVSVKKVWDDDSNADGKRPDSVTVHLYQNGVVYKTEQLSESNGWTCRWAGLPKHHGIGLVTEYAVTEDPVEGYTQQRVVTGDTDSAEVIFTNSHARETTSLTVNKIWDDANDQDGLRPDSLTLAIYADGKKTEETLTLSAAENWVGTKTDLLKYENGREIVYTAKEETVPEGYTIVGDGIADAENEYRIENHHEPEMMTITVNKIWVDTVDGMEDKHGMRPASVQITLYENSVPSEKENATLTLDASGNWSGAWTDMPLYSNGQRILYTVVESGYTTDANEAKSGIPEAYEASYSYDRDAHIATVTNTYAPDYTALNVLKVWDDNGNQDGVRPKQVTVRLQVSSNGTDWQDTDRVRTMSDANKWDVDFVNLPKLVDGAEAKYRVVEDPVEGYSVSYSEPSASNVITVTNTHIPEKTSVTVQKVWDDDNDRDRIRPEEITLELYADGASTGKKATLTEEKAWDICTFENLDKNARGKAIVYTVVETAVNGYTASYADAADEENGGKTITVTNVHTPEKVYIPVQKVWDDDNDRDDQRPVSVNINLLADGETVQTMELNIAGNWYGVFEAPKNEDGRKIAYSITEDKVAGYDDPIITYDAAKGYTVKNHRDIETVMISAHKVWADDDNRDGVRPDKIKLHLMVGGKHLEMPRELNEENGWRCEWKDLPMNAEGLKINYVVIEETVGNGYVESLVRDAEDDNHIIVTNTRSTEKTSVTVQKVWDDANNQDNLRPASVQLQLTANSKNCGDPVTVTAETHWRYTFTDLDKKENGQPIIYSAKEIVDTSTAANYESGDAVTDAQTGLITITNKHVPETVEISVKKVWDDENNADGKRPASVTVRLHRNGVVQEAIQLSKSNDWEYEWENLPKHHGIGLVNEYTVTEDSVAGYTQQRTVERTGDSASVTFTNIHERETTSLTVTKVWKDGDDQDGKRPETLTLEIYAGDEDTGRTMTLRASENWTATVTGLLKYEDGKEIVYTAKEETVPEGYTVVDDGVADSDNNYTITNKREPKLVDLCVEKVWNDARNNDGKRPYQVEVTLLDNGIAVTDDAGNPMTVLLNSKNGWKGVWMDMPRFRNGLYVNYSMIETAYWQTEDGERKEGVADGYTVSHSYPERNAEADVSVATLTNTYAPQTIGLNVQKIWDDNDNQDGLRPDSILVRLWRNLTGDPADWEKTTQTAVMHAENEWDVDFTGLPKYHEGVEILYNVVEDVVPEGYEAEYMLNSDLSLVTIKNTHVPARTTVTVTKEWADNDDQDGMRPDSITLALYANGIAVKDANDVPVTVNVTENDGWKAVFRDLPLMHHGQLISYRVYETPVDGYTVTYGGERNDDGSVDITVTNTHEPLETSVTVKKIWNDAGNQDGIRPASITVNLLAGGKVIQSKAVANTDNWIGTFDALPMYANGERIAYTVSEVVPEGYTGSTPLLKNGAFEITNTHVPEQIEVKAIKVWDDHNDSDGKRPDSIVLHLLANGTHMGEAYKKIVTENDKGEWTCSWTVDKYLDGMPILYSVHEEPVLFRTVTQTGDAAQTPSAHASDRYDPYYAYDTAANTVTITNRYVPETVTVSARKVWIDGDNRDGIRPEKVTVHLCRKDDPTTPLQTAVLDDTNSWYAAWQNMPKYEDGGNLIEYIVVEPESYAGYVSTIRPETEFNPYFFLLTSVHDPAVTGVSVKKVWDDENDNDGKRPEGIIVQLFANGTPLANGRVVLSENNNWSVSWQSSIDYPLYVFEKGVEIVYSVQEVGYIQDGEEVANPPAGYRDSYSNVGYDFTVTNSMATEKIDISIEKVWNDADNNDGKRPEKITVSLLCNNAQIGEKLTLSEENGWKVKIQDQYRYRGGEVAVYAVVEDAVADYTAAYASIVDAESGDIAFTVTNTHAPEVAVRTVTKVWKDAKNAEKLRPKHVEVQLYKDGKVYGDHIRLDADKSWQASVSLPVYEAGKKIEWTIVEVQIPRYYSASYDQETLTVTNTIQSKTVPKTGDYDSFLPYMLMFGGCTIGAAVLLILLKKKRKTK